MSALNPLTASPSPPPLPPPLNERPFHVRHPSIIITVTSLVSTALSMTIAFSSGACGDLEDEHERGRAVDCRISISIVAPIVITTLTHLFVNRLNDRYAARFGVDPFDLEDHGGD